ncbi:MAG: cyclopropane fatty acyl phospholipid synthase [Rhabdochlamydiaceae bacterium]|nr:cyclopropane fatty acyl phospholipid synthase [Candidatus Amphrikana amoebophyrae]
MSKFILTLLTTITFFQMQLVNSSEISSQQKVITEIAALADVQINGDRPWDIQVHNDDFYSLVLSEGSLGLGESYMAGWWDCDDLDGMFMRVLRANVEDKVKVSWEMIWGYVKAKLFNQQTKSKSMKVIEQHYQLGNELYENMLDANMAYSCGYWACSDNLEKAQEAKFDLIARKLGMKKGMTVLDIGCGWGGFAKYIAKNYGVSVIGVTLSENQAELAKKMCKGLPVEIRVQDYRDVKEKFDRIVSIGMFEHVGSKNYRTFMESTHDSLKEGGLMMLHTIGSNESSLTTDAWIAKYIFPNSHLPSIAQIGTSIEQLYVMEDWHNFSVDYDKTLMAWYKNFEKTWPKVKDQYPADFYRMWKYYLLSCAGCFRSRHIQLWQVVLSKEGVLGGYKTVR